MNILSRRREIRDQTGQNLAGLVTDRHTRELLYWYLSRIGEATTAANALGHTLIVRSGILSGVDHDSLLKSDNGQIFISRHDTALVCRCGLLLEFITTHYLQQTGTVERVIRILWKVFIAKIFVS